MSGIEKNTTKADDEKNGFYLRLKSGLQKTRNTLADGINRITKGSAEIGPEWWQELEELLLGADTGIPTVIWIMEVPLHLF